MERRGGRGGAGLLIRQMRVGAASPSLQRPPAEVGVAWAALVACSLRWRAVLAKRWMAYD